MSDASAEQKARDLLEQLGVLQAQSFSAGDVVELANLIARAESLAAQVVQLRGALVELVLLDGLRRRAPGVVESEHDIRWPAAWAAARAALVEQSK